MANQTVTASQSLASVIASGLTDGENIDINSGAVVTATISPTVLIGQTKVNDGVYLWDGANAVNPIIACCESLEEINVNGSGLFQTTLGWFIFTGTSDGTSTYSLNVAEYFSADPNNNITADIFSGLKVETGRRINYTADTGVTPVVGDWLFKSGDTSIHGRIHSVGVGYIVVESLTGALVNGDLIELHTLQENNGIDYQKSWFATCNGADILELDVWTWWANSHQNNADRMTQVGAGIDGRVFYNAWNTNTVTFGDNVNGAIPPVGCRFKLPMVHFCTSDVATYATGLTSGDIGAGNHHNIELALGGEIDFNGLSLGTAYFGDNGASKYSAQEVCAPIALGSAICGSKVILKNCIVPADLFRTANSPRRYPFETSDLALGADISDCAIYNLLVASGETGYLSAVTSKDISFTRCIQVTAEKNQEAIFNTVDGVTIYDCMYFGAGLDLTTVFNADIRLIKFQGQVGNSVAYTGYPITYQKSSNNVFIAGLEFLPTATEYTNYVINVVDASNLKVRGLHFMDDKWNRGAVGGCIRTNGLSSNIDAARCYFDGGSVPAAYVGSTVSTDITFTNVSGAYISEIDPKGFNVKLNGVHGGAANIGTSTGVETDYVGCFGSNFQCAMRSDTTGALVNVFMPDSDKNPFLDIVGNPKFTKDGDFDVLSGDSFTIQSPVYYGITGFTGQFTSSRNSGDNADGTDEIGGNLTVELQYDDGTGYNGVWLDCKNVGDMTSIPDLSTGASFRVRYTATGSRTGNNGVMIHFTTTIAAQMANLYPIDQFEATITTVVTDEETGVPITDARVHIVAAAGGSLVVGTPIINALLVNGLGEASGTINAVPQPFTGLIVDGTEPGLYVPKPVSGTIETATLTLNVGLVSDE